jgi:hypothetical protein
MEMEKEPLLFACVRNINCKALLVRYLFQHQEVIDGILHYDSLMLR